MIASIQPEAPPLRLDEQGVWRVGSTRVLLELLVIAHLNGETPEEIVQRYPTLALPDVYSVIAFYLNHREEVDDYINTRNLEAQELRSWFEARQTQQSEIQQRVNQLRGS